MIKESTTEGTPALISQREAKELIAGELERGKKTRKELLAAGANILPKELRKDKSPSGILNRTKIELGNAIDGLVRSGVIVVTENAETGDRIYEIKKAEDGGKEEPAAEIVKRDDKLRELILGELLKPMARGALFDAVVKKFLQDGNATVTKKAVTCDTGRVIAGLLEEKKIFFYDKKYSTVPPRAEEPTEVDFDAELELMSDECFMQNGMELVKSVYQRCGYSVSRCDIVDGVDDGGIDGVIEARDPFGHLEKIIVQVKHRRKPEKKKSKHPVTPTEMRQFCGVLAAEGDATKGIFVTNAQYHRDARKFAEKFKIKYLALIDGTTFEKLVGDVKFQLLKS